MLCSAAFSPDGQRIVTASEDKTARVWNAATGQLLATLRRPHGRVVHAAFSPDGQRVVTASEDKTARVWNAANGQLLAKLEGHTAQVWQRGVLARRPAHRHRQRGPYGAGVECGQRPTAGHARGHTGRGQQAAFSPDGQRIVTASVDKTARVWNAASGQLLATLEGHTDRVWQRGVLARRPAHRHRQR